MPRLALLLVLQFVLLLSFPANGDPLQDAKDHFRKGTQLYDLGKYLAAADEYQRAFELSDRPGFLFNIGQSLRLGGKPRDALAAYQGFLRRVPAAPQRADVEQIAVALRAQIAEEDRVAAEREAEARRREDARVAAVEPTAPAPTLVEVAPKKPLYKRWWLWTAVVGGAAVVAVGLGVGLTLGRPQEREFGTDGRRF